MKKFLFPLLLIAAGNTLFGRQQDCSCLQDYEKLTEKLEANYVAWHLTKSETAARYAKWKNRYRRLAATTGNEDCVRLLQTFLGFFKDGHLFVMEYPEYTKEELEVAKNKLQAARLHPDAVADYLVSKKNPLGTPEGLWTDGQSKFGIIRRPGAKAGHFAAVILDAPDKSKIGEVKMEMTQADGHFDASYFSDGYSKRNITASLYKDATILYLAGGFYWGRINYTSKDDITNALVFDPVKPLLSMVEEKYAVITLPSFLIDRKILDQFLVDNLQALSQASYWIIDIRGNIGGNGIYFGLLSGYYERPGITGPPGYAIASPDNLEYFSKFNSGTNNPFAPVVKAMQDSMGQLVKGPQFADLVLTPVKTNLQKVVIITDGSNMSAAETFILYSRSVSDKVITMGEPTGGVVDYNNINMVKLSCGKQNIRFGYPTYSRTANAHKNGLNATGILPDVKIPRNVKDKPAYAINYLKSLAASRPAGPGSRATAGQ